MFEINFGGFLRRKRKKEMENGEIIKKEEKEKLPWQKQEEEPLKAYYAFERYLSLGPSRKMSDTARLAEMNRATISKYAKRWNWEERAFLHDKFYSELKKSKNALLIEEIQDEIQEEFVKTEIYIKRAISVINKFLRDFWTYFDDPTSIDKIKYINRAINTLNKMYKMIFQKMPKSMLKEISISNVNINNMLNLDEDLKKISDETNYVIKEVYDKLETETKPVKYSGEWEGRVRI